MKAIRIIITGKVQGVFFRQHTKKTAEQFGVKGFVQNISDGSVYIEAEGDDETLQQFIESCKLGSPQSSVEKLNVSEITFIGFKKFIIRHGDS